MTFDKFIISVKIQPVSLATISVKEEKMSVKEGRVIGDILVEGGFLTQKALDEAQAESRRTAKGLNRILVEEKHLLPETLACVISFSFDVPVVDLEFLEVQKEALRLVPADFAEATNLMPFEVNGDTIRVVMEDPTDKKVLSSLAEITGKEIKPAVVQQGAVRLARKIKEVYSRSG